MAFTILSRSASVVVVILLPPRKFYLTCISHHPTAEARDMAARTSSRLLAVLNVLFKYACARQAARASRLVMTALSCTSPRHVVRNVG